MNEVEIFWELYNNAKRKIAWKQVVKAEVELMVFARSITDFEQFGKYADFVEKWANASLITNATGKHLFVRLDDQRQDPVHIPEKLELEKSVQPHDELSL